MTFSPCSLVETIGVVPSEMSHDKVSGLFSSLGAADEDGSVVGKSVGDATGAEVDAFTGARVEEMTGARVCFD